MKKSCLFALTLTFLLSLTKLTSAQPQLPNTDASFRGLSVVSEKIIWASGTKGTFVRTVDGGKNWQVGNVPDAEKLDFRDVEAFSADVAYVLSIGNGDASRIYKTVDGGKTWKLQFKNENPKIFLDAFAFWDEQHGIAMSDSVAEKFMLFATNDGGANWLPLVPNKIPAAQKDEGGFAASGTCIVTQGKNNVWIGTGKGRILRSTDRGKNWEVSATPIMTGNESSGIFGIAFKDSKNGMIVGGDYREPNKSGNTAAITNDGGKTWRLIADKLPFRSGIAFTQGAWVAVGTSGANHSADQGMNWREADRANYNVVAAKAGKIWAAGPKGKLTQLLLNAR